MENDRIREVIATCHISVNWDTEAIKLFTVSKTYRKYI